MDVSVLPSLSRPRRAHVCSKQFHGATAGAFLRKTETAPSG